MYGERKSRQIARLLHYLGGSLRKLVLEVTEERIWGDLSGKPRCSAFALIALMDRNGTVCGKLGLWQCSALRELRLDIAGEDWYRYLLPHAPLLLSDLFCHAESRAKDVTLELDLYYDLESMDDI